MTAETAVGLAQALKFAADTGSAVAGSDPTGVRLSTPEDCDLRFYSCGDAGLTTGSQLRIVITARGRCWSRSVYSAGRFSALRWGRRSGSRAARDSYFLPVWRRTGGNAAGRGRKREASAVYVHLYEGPSDASRHDATGYRPPLQR